MIQNVAAPNAAILETIEVHRAYALGSRSVPVLKGVNLRFAERETVSIIGKSGVGKSTLLQILGLLDRPTSGEIRVRGRDVGRLSRAERAEVRRREIGFVFQFYHLIPELTALENVMLSGRIGEPFLRAFLRRREERARAVSLLERVGLGSRLHHRPRELSGGELQRTAIARALYAKPAILLCDEPTGNLDADTGAAILELLFSLQHETATTLVIVTHDLEVARRCSRTIRLRDGRAEEESVAGAGIGTIQ